MAAPLSLDLRRRFQRYIEDGLSGRAAARRLMISPATGARLAGRVRRGEPLAPRQCGRPRGWGKLGPHRAFLIELVEQVRTSPWPSCRAPWRMRKAFMFTKAPCRAPCADWASRSKKVIGRG